MGLLDYLDPDALRGKLAAALRGTPAAQLVRGELPTQQGLKDTLLAQKPFNAADLTGAMEGANWANPMMAAKIVYHGSPHKFDKFDASKIGTGEGAQAYGHGVYLADSEGVAKGYQAMHGAAELRKDGNRVAMYGSENKGVLDILSQNGGDYDRAINEMSALEKSHGGMYAGNAKKNIEKLTEWRNAGYEPVALGSLYKADLPDEWIPKMLDWDKPLSQQPENVRLLAQDLGLANGATGKDVYSALSNQARDMGIIKGQNAQTTLPGSQSRAATDLSEFGIPGIRYLDGGSRGAGQGSYNYVVFPGLEDKVKILERNGKPINPMADALRNFNGGS